MALGLAAALALGACGSGGGETTSAPTADHKSTPQHAKSSRPTDRGRSQKATEDESPIDEANPRIKALQANFPPPKPAPKAKGLSAKAIAEGEEACAGMTPSEAKDAYLDQAKPNLDQDQLGLVDELPRYEEEAVEEASFIAGQIAATIYEATLPEAQREFGFQGCVYALSRALAEEISKEGEGR